MQSTRLECPQCNWQATCTQVEIEQRLRGLGLLRRAPHPPEDLVAELLNVHARQLACDRCGAVGLAVSHADDADTWDDWQQAVVCEVCKKPIPLERLEVFSDATRCVGCQDVADRGEEAEEPDFCPKCGSLVELRVSQGSGVTRYKLFCTGSPPCRL